MVVSDEVNGPNLIHAGITVKVCVYDESDRITCSTEDKIIYTEEDFRDFLTRRGWSGLREVGGFRDIDSIEELRIGGVYQRGSNSCSWGKESSFFDIQRGLYYAQYFVLILIQMLVKNGEP